MSIAIMPGQPRLVMLADSGETRPVAEKDLRSICHANGIVVLEKGQYLCSSCGGIRTTDECRFCPNQPLGEVHRCGKCATILALDVEQEVCHYCHLYEEFGKLRGKQVSSPVDLVQVALLRDRLTHSARFISDALEMLPDDGT